jgi:hypothetical protein
LCCGAYYVLHSVNEAIQGFLSMMAFCTRSQRRS